jgi:hypothetical protein
MHEMVVLFLSAAITGVAVVLQKRSLPKVSLEALPISWANALTSLAMIATGVVIELALDDVLKSPLLTRVLHAFRTLGSVIILSRTAVDANATKAVSLAALILPGLCTLVWPLISNDKTVRVALRSAVCCWIGLLAGLVLAFATELWPLPSLVSAPHAAGSSGIAVALSLREVVSLAVSGLLAYGVAGVLLAAAWQLVVQSQAPRRMLRNIVFMPVGLLALSAVLSPPDVVTQMLLAGALGLFWLGGLAAGFATCSLRK